MSAIIGTSNILAVQKVAGIIICKYCKIGLPSDRRASIHLKDKHRFDKTVAKSLSAKAQKALDKVLKNPHPLRDLYNKAPQPLAGPSSKSDAFYTPLEGIQTISGFGCTLCPKCCPSEKSMRDHFSEEHGDHSLSIGDQWNRCVGNGSLQIQTLFSGNKTSYFPVSASAPVGEVQAATSASQDITSPRSATLHSQSEPAHPQPAPEQQSPTSHAPEMPIDVIRQENAVVQEVFAEMDQAFSSNNVEEDLPRSKMNAFLARTKFDIMLRKQRITMEDPATYSGHLGDYNQQETVVQSDVKNYLLKVPDTILDLAPAILQDLNMRGKKEFTAVSTKSAEKYARNFARGLISALRLEGNPLLTSSLTRPLQEYRQAIQDPAVDEEARSRLLHALLKTICLQRLEKMESPCSLFICTFIACATVLPRSRSQRDSFRFAQATDISLVLASLLYGASSVAIT